MRLPLHIPLPAIMIAREVSLFMTFDSPAVRVKRRLGSASIALNFGTKRVVSPS